MLEQSGGKERGGKSYIVFQPKMAEKIHKELNFHETGKLQFFCGGGGFLVEHALKIVIWLCSETTVLHFSDLRMKTINIHTGDMWLLSYGVWILFYPNVAGCC